MWLGALRYPLELASEPSSVGTDIRKRHWEVNELPGTRSRAARMGPGSNTPLGDSLPVLQGGTGRSRVSDPMAVEGSPHETQKIDLRTRPRMVGLPAPAFCLLVGSHIHGKRLTSPWREELHGRNANTGSDKPCAAARDPSTGIHPGIKPPGDSGRQLDLQVTDEEETGRPTRGSKRIDRPEWIPEPRRRECHRGWIAPDSSCTLSIFWDPARS